MRRGACDLVSTLSARGLTLATAESLTGGQVAAAVTSVPGASRAYLGGVVSYATDVKVDVLGVSDSVVREHGVVSAPCAGAMAEGVRLMLKSDYGVATTGVAGPDPQDGHPVGTAFVGVAGPHGTRTLALRLSGDRPSIQHQTVERALGLLGAVLRGEEPDVG
jgi:nicotinamide-nucleotide amidase